MSHYMNYMSPPEQCRWRQNLSAMVFGNDQERDNSFTIQTAKFASRLLKLQWRHMPLERKKVIVQQRADLEDGLIMLCTWTISDGEPAEALSTISRSACVSLDRFALTHLAFFSVLFGSSTIDHQNQQSMNDASETARVDNFTDRLEANYRQTIDRFLEDVLRTACESDDAPLRLFVEAVVLPDWRELRRAPEHTGPIAPEHRHHPSEQRPRQKRHRTTQFDPPAITSPPRLPSRNSFRPNCYTHRDDES